MPKSCTLAVLLVTLDSAFTFGASLEPPKLRLGEDARPVRYRLDLTLIPDEDTFGGSIDIDLELRKPTDVVWLNARHLTIDQANFVSGGRTTAAKIQDGGKEFAGFVPASALPAGKATLQISYHGELNKKGSGGLFKQQEGGDWYVYSQFEAIEARQAFPCFDEPSFKVPWQITLHVKKEHAAVSNTPVESESDEGGGRKKLTFAETKPLPSYLVAVGVGPFDFVDAGKAGKKRTQVRIVVPKGKSAQAKYAVEATGPILEQLESYFGIPYPYEKLDALAVPLFGGAMENPGLITYGQSIILSEPAEDSMSRQRSYARIAAHEMAHQWFGDLVTMAWWNDTWLNEAFASWMGAKIIHQWKPEWNTKVDEQNSRLGAMEDDSLISARKIRQPIESNDDIANAFDGITYSKGQAVIGMFESWMGEDTLRRGVQRYLRQYSWRNATAGDFLDSMDTAGGSTHRVSTAFATFLDQAGTPLISVKLHCDAPGGPSLRLSQTRALPLGSQGSTVESWQIPFCVRYGEGDRTRRECTLLTNRAEEWKLPSAKSCPAWILGNADGAGYYRVRYEGDLLHSLLADGGRHLSPAERVATLGDVEALATMGEIKAADALSLVPQFANDPVRQVVTSAAGIVAGVREHLLPHELLPNYARFIEKTFGERAHELGWHAQSGEAAETRLLRSSIVPLVAVWGRDEALAAEARQLSQRWLADRNAVDPDIVGSVLRVAARTGDRALFDRLTAALAGTEDRRQRELILSALGSFRDPEIVRTALALLLRPEFDMREGAPLIFGPLSTEETEGAPFDFVRQNYDAIVAKMPTGEGFDFGAILPFVGSDFCDERSHDEVAAFFEPKVDRFTGAKRNLAQVLEGIRLCTALQSAQQASVAEFFRKY